MQQTQRGFGTSLSSVGICLLAACASTRDAAPVVAVDDLAHAVFFDLQDAADAPALVRDCRTRLAAIPGVKLLEVGTRCPEFTGPRNDQTFDVALWVVFEDRAAHDAYQVHPEHRGLVEAWTPKLAGVEVFDAWVQ